MSVAIPPVERLSAEAATARVGRSVAALTTMRASWARLSTTSNEIAIPRAGQS